MKFLLSIVWHAIAFTRLAGCKIVVGSLKSAMIEVIENIPPTVVGFRATGTVTGNDYKNVVFPQVERYLRTAKYLNYLFIIDTPLNKFSMRAWLEDFRLRVQELRKWKHVAIVSRSGTLRRLTQTAGHLFPGKYRGFAIDDLDEAIAWVASGK